MGNHFLNVLTIGADEAAEGNVIVPDLNVPALPEQTFHQLHLRAFS